MDVILVDTVTAVESLIDSFIDLPTQPPSLFLDIEGVALSRSGTISIIQIYVQPMQSIFLIDVHILQGQAFDTPNASGITLRSMLESDRISKVFFDVRNDADALFGNYGVSMQCVEDVQLLECATRKSRKTYVVGLATCIEKDSQLTTEAKVAFQATKRQGRAMFVTELGGSFEVFNERPIRKELIEYCTQDVVYLPVLWKIYMEKVSPEWEARVREETLKRLLIAQDPNNDPKQQGKTASPWAHEDFAQTESSHRSSLRQFWAHDSWTCEVCDRDMQLEQMDDHLAGKAHAARLRRAHNAMSEPFKSGQTCADNGGFVRFDASGIPRNFWEGGYRSFMKDLIDALCDE